MRVEDNTSTFVLHINFDKCFFAETMLVQYMLVTCVTLTDVFGYMCDTDRHFWLHV